MKFKLYPKNKDSKVEETMEKVKEVSKVGSKLKKFGKGK